MIRSVILHILGDHPLRVDLEGLPEKTDTHILCTNVLTMDGKRPTFVENKRSRFIFPLSTVRLIELPISEEEAQEEEEEEEEIVEPAPPPALEVDEEPDEDLLARIRNV